ncbi:MAG: hypothetical protein IKT34_00675 [Clostridia bacterium]|nr:hypothetical protein [Clostridia bacterium]
MSDKIAFDFETGEIYFDTPTQFGIEIDPDLKSRKKAIFAAAGYQALEISDIVESFNRIFRDLGVEEVKLFERRK